MEVMSASATIFAIFPSRSVNTVAVSRAQTLRARAWTSIGRTVPGSAERIRGELLPQTDPA
jgi:hypothetical protein